jgi:4-amino-4-deoxy-L-arabinose transferase-like glycosyltransferase
VSQGQNRQDMDAFAETQVIRAIPAQGPPPQEPPSSNGKQSTKPQGAQVTQDAKPEGVKPQGSQSALDDDADPLARTESVAARIPLKSGATQVSPGTPVTPVTPPKPSTAEDGRDDAEKPQALSVERESSRAAKAQPDEAESSRDRPSLFQEHAPSTSRPSSSHRRSTQPKQSDPAQHSPFRPQEPSPAEKLEAEWPSLFRPEPPSAASSPSVSPAEAEEVKQPLPRIPPFQPQAQPPIAEILGQPDGVDPEATQRRSRPRVSGNFDFAAETQATNSRRPSIPVPPEFLSAARFRTDGASPGLGTSPTPAADPVELSDGPGTGLRARPQQDESELDAAAFTVVRPPAPAKTPAPAKPEKPEKPDDGGFSSGPPKWQDHVPFDETGVLLRPEALRHHAMQAETELMSVIKVDAGDDGSEAAKAQRPGFWTGAWPRRGLLTLIMLIQSILSLRQNNSPFEDESLYLYSGHLELGHVLFGTSTVTDFWSEFSGAPVLYPILGALADQVGGIFAARLLSLIFMLGTTGLLYLITRRLFGTRAALCAAALFSCIEATIFLGGLATYDAPALFLLALSAWIVVRFANNTFPFYLLAVFPAALAVATKYVSLLFVPTIVVLALIVSLRHFGKWAWIRPVSLSAGLGMVLYAAYKAAGASAATGISVTTTNRAEGTDSLSLVMDLSAQYGGIVFAVALIGGVFVVQLPQRHSHPAVPKARWQRAALVLLLAGTALLAPLYQAHLHTTVSLQKHVGFGAFFAAPLAGYGLVRIVGPHLHRVQLGIGIIVLNLALGMGQSLYIFHSWPNSYAMVAELAKYQKPGAHYFVGNASNAIYELRGDPDAQPSQFTDAFYFGYYTSQGKYITGNAAYALAIQSGYFQVLAYDYSADPAVEQAVAEDLYRSPNYEMVARIPVATSGGPGYAYVWVRKG